MKKLMFLAVIAMVLTVFNACEKDASIDLADTFESHKPVKEGEICLGKKLNNPYSVENIKVAYQNLRERNQLKSAITIEPTHLYIRFLPSNEQEYELLRRTELELFDYPMDYEFEEGGVYYHDPSIPNGQITWQYASVPIDFQLPNMKYEIIEYLYLGNSGTSDLKSANINNSDWFLLENEALQITGNAKITKSEGNQLKGSSWNPSGTIRVWDNVQQQYVPVAGVRVRSKYWFNVDSEITDENGHFRMWSYTSEVTYSIKWERDDFDIRSGSYGQAYYNGPEMRGEWNLDIQQSQTPESYLYAHIHRAAITYYYQNWRWGIKTPPTRDGVFKVLQQRLHIGGKDKSGTAHYFNFNSFVQSAQVVIYSSSDNGTLHDSREIFGRTIHELAHASHWELAYSNGQWVLDKLFAEPKLPESWAEGVEWKITNDIYDSALFYSYEDMQWLTINKIKNNDGYTPIVIDLMDNVNQRILHGGNTNYPDDQVERYTLSQLEGALPDALGSWWNWRTIIKEKYNNPTEEYVDYLFHTYN